MQDGGIIIRDGGLAAEVVPAAGGLLRRFTAEIGGRRHEVLYCPEGSVGSVAKPSFFGTWSLVPWANRAFGGIVDDGEIRFEVPANSPDGSGSIHGFGWQSAWTVEETAADRVAIAHRRRAGPDPFRYVSRQTITVGPAGLRIDLTVTNEADRPLPFGLGLHPWFPKRPDTVLRLEAAGALVLGPGFRATGHGPVPAAGDFSAGQRVARDGELVWSLTGWSGEARISSAAEGLAVTLRASPELAAPLLWSPPDAPFFCVEPQTHAVGAPSEAIVRTITPLRRLAPGETLAVWMEIEPTEL